MRTHPTPRARSSSLKNMAYFTALLTMGTVCSYAQTVAPESKSPASGAPDTATLAKYDVNHDGTLDTKESAAMEADMRKAAKESKTENEEGTIELSPFVVTENEGQGYEATNVMSGSRLNTKLEDVPASISVVTKAQLLDFAATDINDIFAMEAGTEGTRNFTANINDGKGDVDNVANNPESANRIRGVSKANIAVGNFGMSSSIPFDTYNIDGVEISKGANSSIFGVGEAGGTVNLVPSAANLFKDRSGVSLSMSSYRTKRGTLDVNRVIFKGKLAIRLNGLLEDKGFERRPSYDKTRRGTLSVTAKPFKETTIRASFENYEERYSRPNSVTATNFMSIWEAAGRPTYDPSTNLVTTPGTNTLGGLPTDWLYVAATGNAVRPTMWVDKGQVQAFQPSSWWVPTTYSSTGSPTAWSTRVNPFFSLKANYGVPAAYIGGIGYTGVPASTDRNFYDYTSINLAALNHGLKRANFGRVELEQFFLRTRRHMLALQLGAFRERIRDESRNFVGNGGDGVAATIVPDINLHLPDGSVNPYYGSPYVGALAPQTYLRPVRNITYKANLAYQLDMTGNKGWTKWFGLHRLLGYKEYFQSEYSPQALRYRDQITSSFADRWVPQANKTTPNVAWMASPIGTNNNFAIYNIRYYVGDASGGNIDYPSSSPDFSQPLSYRRWGSTTSTLNKNQWNTENVTVGTQYFAIGSVQKQQRTQGYIYQGWLFKDRILPIYGERTDTLRTRNNNAEPSGVRDVNGFVTDDSFLMSYDGSPWLVSNKATGATVNKGKTRTKGLIVRPLKWLSLRYNQSNSFKPEDYAIDYKGTPLPNPYGMTKDYGIGLSLFENKLYLRLTRYDTSSKDARNTGLNAVSSRITTMDFDPNPDRNDSKFDVEDWLVNEYAKVDGFVDATASSGATDAMIAAWTAKAHANMGLSDQLISDLRTYSRVMTSDATSKGYELEVNYNPTRFWTMKLTGNQIEAINKNMSRTWLDYRNSRLPYWQNLKSPYLTPERINSDGTVTPAYHEAFWTKTFPSNTIPANYFVANMDAPMKLNYALEGKPVPQNRKYRFSYMTNIKLAQFTGNKILSNVNIGGRLSWEDRAAIGFGPAKPDADGIIREYDANTVYYDGRHTYVDLFAGYDFKLANDKVRGRVQLNVRNAFEGGRLQAFSVNPDGTPTRYRIIDPREFVFTLSFDL